ncbi:hypothetical protein SLH49_10045 [Cognatiyoonia sp. IB215446]|uniref:hypothetical protein n=1 Tax=Cognatiyoonia sp. IB215446 TaxID=3097355 RepID=UPI002A0E9B8A|nr:hypothetical protein [Cognatiyoonia sp. IB215446]MDX8348328.1 hypothetical protein [Cognatiyoonia sp. IB215446]
MNMHFTPAPGLDGVYLLQSAKLTSFALRLKDGTYCLYSPIAGMAQEAQTELGEKGGISVLLAPNHYHNMGLKEHVAAFPRATLMSSNAAAPRLKKITGLAFSDVKALAPQLPDGTRLLEPEGLKTGEVWSEIVLGEEVAWVVTDAFSTKRHPAGEEADAPSMLGTFPKYGIKDSGKFCRWVEKQLALRPPTILLSCHGSPLRDGNLATALQRLLNETFCEPR